MDKRKKKPLNKVKKKCQNKGCNNTFVAHKTTDKYCSFDCAKLHFKPIVKKNIKPIKQTSDKRKRESFLYKKKRLTFLHKKDNFWCPVAKEVFGEEIPAEEIHHKAGRVGKLLNYVPYWLAVCRKGHVWIHQNPKEAYKKGFLIHSAHNNLII